LIRVRWPIANMRRLSNSTRLYAPVKGGCGGADRMPSVSAAASPLPPPRAPSDRKSCARRITALSALVCGVEQGRVLGRQGGRVFERDWARGRRVGGSEPREQGGQGAECFFGRACGRACSPPRGCCPSARARGLLATNRAALRDWVAPACQRRGRSR
jgi:hypothetical protein